MRTNINIIIIQLINLLLTIACTGVAQSDNLPLKILKDNFENTDTYEFLFLERELIDFCIDSVGRNRFIKKIDRQRKFINAYNDQRSTTELLTLSLLNERIKMIDVENKNQKESKNFIQEKLDKFNPTFEVNEHLIADLFDHKKRDIATKEVCDVGVSMYVIFVYNPKLYVKVLKENKTINPEGKIFFPKKCTIQEYDRSFELRQKMKEGLLNMLKNSEDDDLRYLYEEILKSSITGSNN